MTVIFHNQDIAELQADTVIINELQDALDLIYLPELNGAGKIILYQENITPAFFDLSTRLAGDVLQKFVQYRMQVAIVGNFNNVTSKSLADFIRESNRGRHVFFAENIEQAIRVLSV
jgi:hypothetical protein